MLHAHGDVGVVEQPFAGSDAAQHLLTPAELDRDHVCGVRVAVAQVTAIHAVVVQELHESGENRQKFIFLNVFYWILAFEAEFRIICLKGRKIC